MSSTMTRLFGGANRERPISYDTLYQTFSREAYPKDGPTVEHAQVILAEPPKADDGPGIS